MIIDIQYFGQVAEITSRTQERLELENQTTVAQLDELLCHKHPQLSKLSYKIAVDQTFATSETLLTSKNEIALLPPFSGG